jgi:hypothetical protein
VASYVYLNQISPSFPPDGSPVLIVNFLSNFAAVTASSAILAVVTALLAILAVVI